MNSKKKRVTQDSILKEIEILRSEVAELRSEISYYKTKDRYGLLTSGVARMEEQCDLFAFAAKDLGYYKVTGTRYGRKGFWERLLGAKGASW